LRADIGALVELVGLIDGGDADDARVGCRIERRRLRPGIACRRRRGVPGRVEALKTRKAEARN
jgi:hypothetical protein